jgi:hypothetical protein
LSGRAADLPEDVEHDLVSNVVQVGERLFGLKRKYFRQLAYEVVGVMVLWFF